MSSEVIDCLYMTEDETVIVELPIEFEDITDLEQQLVNEGCTREFFETLLRW